MASVLNPCKGQHSSEQNDGIRLYTERDTDRYIQTMLDKLPPSKELLQAYKDKLDQYEREEQVLLGRIQSCAVLLDSTGRLEREINVKNTLIDKLREDIDTLSHDLQMVKTENLRLSADNQRLKLTSAGGNEQRRPPSSSSMSRHSSRAGKQPQDTCGYHEETISYLENQILAQEKIHKEHLNQDREQRKQAEGTLKLELDQERKELKHMQATIRGLEKQVEKMSNELVAERRHHRAEEKGWLEERTTLHRKLQVLEKMSGIMPNKNLAGNTEERFDLRTSEDRAQRKLIQKLNNQVKEQEGLINRLTVDLREANDERTELQDQISVIGESLSRRTQQMTSQLKVAQDRADKEASRRAMEAEGYRADIARLKGEMSKLERTMAHIVGIKKREKENQEMVEEIEELARQEEKTTQTNKKKLQRPEWVN